ncbi:hypothetical protein TWF694_008169 [Orbilia ellipsospora]|uniref:Uncharacterized protein n=1 Tax=Orbilia ellipsospora TaxID=2528407 RepID=A0AAV9XHY8_9PEZI
MRFQPILLFAAFVSAIPMNLNPESASKLAVIQARQEPTNAEIQAAIEHVVSRLPADRQEAARARMNTPDGINFVKAGIKYFKDAKAKSPAAVPAVDISVN